MRSLRMLLGLLVAGGTACSLTESAKRPVHLVLDVGSLPSRLQGDFRSVMDRVEFTITDHGGEQQTRQLDPGVFDPVSDVEVDEGEVTFAVVVRNTEGSSLYVGQTTMTIEADGFNVTIIPQLVSPVLVVSPRQPTPEVSVTPNGRTYVYHLSVRNPGSGALLRHVVGTDTLPLGFFALNGTRPQNDGTSCLSDVSWAPGHVEPTDVSFLGRPTATTPPATGIPSVSNSGNLTMPTTP